ncbi:MAG: hypothetical protein RSB99_04060 [Bacilli bacterium]
MEKDINEDLDQSFVEEKHTSVGRIIFNIIFTILVVIILSNAVIGSINFSRISNNQKPIILTKVIESTKDSKKIKTYNQILFSIVETETKTTTGIDKTWSLKPFFMK